jgi:hypothetical protein
LTVCLFVRPDACAGFLDEVGAGSQVGVVQWGGSVVQLGQSACGAVTGVEGGYHR